MSTRMHRSELRVRYAALLAPVVALVAASCGDPRDNCYWTTTCVDSGGAGSGSGGSAGAPTGGALGMGGVADAQGGKPSATGGESAFGGAGGAGGVGGSEGGAGGAGGGLPPVCDTTLSPSVDTCVASDEHALFVAPTGSDKADGTQLNPLKTITQATALAAARGKVVIVCNGKFDEHLSLKTGTRLYGGFACPGETSPWTYQPGKRALVLPSTEGPALDVRNVLAPVTVEDVEFDAADATTPGASSIAAIVEDSASVVLTRVKIAAGKAAAGLDGLSGAKGDDGPAAGPAQQGTGASCGVGAPLTQNGGLWPIESTCGSQGGSGGPSQKNNDGFPGGAGNPRSNVTVTDPDALKNGGAEGVEGTDGRNGSAGNPGSAGKMGADDSSFSALGFVASSSAGSGTDGFPGQGGGGGGASNAVATCIGASGGAGGMGGCGGKAGTGGAGGGASVALLSWTSNITLDSCELVASEGGAGGTGGDGGLAGLGKAGAVGGAANTTPSVGKAGSGGKGGDGGLGGPGAGGNGGPSYALVFKGSEPLTATSTLRLGKAGPAGIGGKSAQVQAQSGHVGAAASVFAVSP